MWETSSGCQQGYFLCKSSRKCISQRFLCNGRNDCYDRSDESESACCKSVLFVDKFFFVSFICVFNTVLVFLFCVSRYLVLFL